MLDLTTRPDLKGDFLEAQAQIGDEGSLALKIYGGNPVIMPEVPLNANETGNTKVEDMLGVPSKNAPVRQPTGLDNLGPDTGGSLMAVTKQYTNALAVAERVGLPTVFAQLYNAPAVPQPLRVYDVADIRPNTRGLLERVYAGYAPGAAGVEAARTFPQKFFQWLQTGEFK